MKNSENGLKQLAQEQDLAEARQEISSAYNPIFIVGAPRSGTTLLQFMLRSHPRISIPTGESHFFIPMYLNRSKFGDLSRHENISRVLKTIFYWSREFIETDLHGLKFDIDPILKLIMDRKAFSIPKIFSVIYEANALGEGKRRWGEKTPWYVLHMESILEMYPKAQIIHMIRDGRDVALSLFQRHMDFGVYNAYCAAEYWSHYVDVGQLIGKTLPKSSYCECRYEDLISNPYETVSGLCEFLHEEFDEKVVKFDRSNMPGKTPLLTKSIQKNNAFKWKEQLSRSSVRAFESVAGKTLIANGYELTRVPVEAPFTKKALYQTHNAICNLVYRRNFEKAAELGRSLCRLISKIGLQPESAMLSSSTSR